MKSSLSLLLAASALLLAGCSSTPTHKDTGPIRARTFSFIQPGPKPQTFEADTRQPIHDMIQEAITRNLTARGLSRVASGGDVTVAYLVIVGDNVSTTLINDYFGYGRNASALHEQAQDAYSASKNPNHFEAGTLLVDLLDAKTFKLLERNYASRPILRDLPADARAARIQDVVDEILRNVRFVSP